MTKEELEIFKREKHESAMRFFGYALDEPCEVDGIKGEDYLHLLKCMKDEIEARIELWSI